MNSSNLTLDFLLAYTEAQLYFGPLHFLLYDQSILHLSVSTRARTSPAHHSVQGRRLYLIIILLFPIHASSFPRIACVCPLVCDV